MNHAKAKFMVWYTRILGEGLCYHVRVQCNNKDFRFQDDTDFESYLEILAVSRELLGFHLHHYALMHTHVHLILTTPGPALLDKVMHRINRSYAINYHKRHKRYGHFWMNGYRSSVIDTDTYALTCMRYLDRNPIRAGITSHPNEWPWSSHNYYASNIPNPLLTPHPSYLGLANLEKDCTALYSKFVLSVMPSDERREKEYITRSLKQYGWRLDHTQHPASE